MENKIFAHIISPLQRTSLSQDITASHIFNALGAKETVFLSDLYVKDFCRKPLIFERAQSLPNRRAVSAFKTIKKANFISLDLLHRIKSQMGNLTPTEALVTMLLFGSAKEEKGYLYSYCDTFDFNVSEELDFTLSEPFVKVIPKGQELWFFADRPLLEKGDIIELHGFKFSLSEIVTMENEGSAYLAQSDFPVCEKPILQKDSRSLFKIKAEENSGKKYILSGAVIDQKDTLIDDRNILRPFLIKF